jgi:hypothetical protein
MKQHQTGSEWPVLEPDDPPLDLSRETAAYEKVRHQLLQDHRGKIALIHGDEVVGVFSTVNDALLEGYRRFGYVRMVAREIRDDEEVEYIGPVDIHHPSFKKLDLWLAHLRQRQIKSAEVLPAVFGRHLLHGLAKQRAGFRCLTQKQRGHAPVEEDGNAQRLLLPKQCGLLCLTAMPSESGLLIRQGRLPLDGGAALELRQPFRSFMKPVREAQYTHNK